MKLRIITKLKVERIMKSIVPITNDLIPLFRILLKSTDNPIPVMAISINSELAFVNILVMSTGIILNEFITLANMKYKT
jgi:hypothetical protein